MIGQTICSHCFADECTEARRGQWLAEEQLEKQGQSKARTYFQASHVQAPCDLQKEAAGQQGKKHLGNRVGGHPEGKGQVTASRSTSRSDSVLESSGENWKYLLVRDKCDFWMTIQKCRQFLWTGSYCFEKFVLVWVLGKLMPKPGFCYLLWNHWEAQVFCLAYFHHSVWATSMKVWKASFILS